jgi:hypothetical protein
MVQAFPKFNAIERNIRSKVAKLRRTQRPLMALCAHFVIDRGSNAVNWFCALFVQILGS